MRKDRKTIGFTLVELIVVMTVIGILMGITIVTFNSMMRTKRRESVRLFLSDIKAAMEMYESLWGKPPFNISPIVFPTVYTENQNGIACDNMTNADYRWIQQRGPLLTGKDYKWTVVASPALREALDPWGGPFIVRVVDPAAATPPPERLTAQIGKTKIALYSTGPDCVDQVGTGDEADPEFRATQDDIGLGGD